MPTKIIRIFVVSVIFLTVFESILGLLFVVNMLSFAELRDYATKTLCAVLIGSFVAFLISLVRVYWRAKKL